MQLEASFSRRSWSRSLSLPSPIKFRSPFPPYIFAQNSPSYCFILSTNMYSNSTHFTYPPLHPSTLFPAPRYLLPSYFFPHRPVHLTPFNSTPSLFAPYLPPPLALENHKPVFTLQMCIDVEKSTIYVFGGRILTRYLLLANYFCHNHCRHNFQVTIM